MRMTPEQLADHKQAAECGKAFHPITVLAILRHIDAQQARIADLEKDAARYRWLREFGYGLPRLGGELDTSIDAAMQPTWPEDTSDYGSRIAVIWQNGNDGLSYKEQK